MDAYIPDENAALKYVRTKQMSKFSRDELAYLAAKARLPEKPVLDTAIDTVTRFHAAWQSEKKNLPMPKAVVDAIETHVKTVPIVREKRT